MEAEDNTLCSVVMPLYNCEKFLAESLQSALRQTWTRLEILLIEDGSADHTLSLAKTYAAQHENIVLLCNEKNQGVAYSRNRGIEAAKGAYIAFLDGDDAWEPEKIASQIEFMRRERCDVCCSSYTMMDEGGAWIGECHVPEEKVTLGNLLKENYIGMSSVLIKADIAKRYAFSKSYLHEDYAYWLTLLHEKCRILAMNEQLTRYRVRASSRSGNKLVAAKGRWVIYRNLLQLDWLTAAYYFVFYFFYGLKKYYFPKIYVQNIKR